MTNLLSSKFWFTIYPPDLSPISVKIFIALIGVLIISSVVIKIFIMISKEKLYRRLLRKIQSLIITNIITLLVMFFLMYETVPFLSGRFWFLFWFFVNGVWFYFIFKFYLEIPRQKEERKKQAEYNKYIP